MIGLEDLESYLIRSDLDYEEIADGIWAVHADGGEALFLGTVALFICSCVSSRVVCPIRRHPAFAH